MSFKAYPWRFPLSGSCSLAVFRAAAVSCPANSFQSRQSLGRYPSREIRRVRLEDGGVVYTVSAHVGSPKPLPESRKEDGTIQSRRRGRWRGRTKYLCISRKALPGLRIEKRSAIAEGGSRIAWLSPRTNMHVSQLTRSSEISPCNLHMQYAERSTWDAFPLREERNHICLADAGDE